MLRLHAAEGHMGAALGGQVRPGDSGGVGLYFFLLFLLNIVDGSIRGRLLCGDKKKDLEIVRGC